MQLSKVDTILVGNIVLKKL